ncbi:hypothetical protein cypCar_00049632, partial [Cyprinus carpio]
LVRHGSQVATVHTTPFPISPQNLVHCDDVTVVCDWQEERLRRGDDLRLQMAIEESKREKAKPEESSLMELSGVDPWGAPATGSAGPSPPPVLASASTAGPWGPADPWGAASPASPPSTDPWGGAPATVAPDPWGDSSSRVNSDPWASTGESVKDVSSQCPLCDPSKCRPLGSLSGSGPYPALRINRSLGSGRSCPCH